MRNMKRDGNMDNVCEIGCFILDLDGTVYLGNEVIAGAIDFLKTLTSNFIVTLLSSIILLIFVPILNIVNINKK